MTTLPPNLSAIIDEFASAPRDVVLEMLLEFASSVKPLPASSPGAMEQVTECQTPFFVRAAVHDGLVDLHFDVPVEAPTTRAFAGILTEGLDGASTDEVLAVPLDIYDRMGLSTVISPLRIRGATAVLTRIQRQVRASTG